MGEGRRERERVRERERGERGREIERGRERDAERHGEIEMERWIERGSCGQKWSSFRGLCTEMTKIIYF